MEHVKEKGGSIVLFAVLLLAGLAVGKRMETKARTIEQFNASGAGVYEIQGRILSMNSIYGDDPAICMTLEDRGHITNEICIKDDTGQPNTVYGELIKLKVQKPGDVGLEIEKLTESKPVLPGRLTGRWMKVEGSKEPLYEVELDNPTGIESDGSDSRRWSRAANFRFAEAGTEVVVDVNGAAWVVNPEE